MVYGSTGSSVDHGVITLADGTTIRVWAVRAGSQKFFGSLSARQRDEAQARSVIARQVSHPVTHDPSHEDGGPLCLLNARKVNIPGICAGGLAR